MRKGSFSGLLLYGGEYVFVLQAELDLANYNEIVDGARAQIDEARRIENEAKKSVEESQK